MSLSKVPTHSNAQRSPQGAACACVLLCSWIQTYAKTGRSTCCVVQLCLFPHFSLNQETQREEGWTTVRCSTGTRSTQDFPQIKYVNRTKTNHCGPLPGAPEMELNCLNQLEFTLSAAAAALFGLGSFQSILLVLGARSHH